MGGQAAKKVYQYYVPPAKEVPEWYKHFNFVLIESLEDLYKVFKDVEPKRYYMGFDTETTGLDFEQLDLVGYSFCLDGKTTYYVPIYHFEYAHNLGEPAVEFIYKKMCEAKMVFMYNARYDMRVFEFRGYKANKDKLKDKRFRYVKYDMSKVNYFDVAVPVWLADTNKKLPSLKFASEQFLGFKQMHFDEVVEGAGNFFYLNPSENPNVAYYAGADALCTFLLVPATIKFFKESQLAGKIDNKVLYPLMHYEEEKIWIDEKLVKEYTEQAKKLVAQYEHDVYDAVGYEFNLNSTAQVGMAFSRLGIDTGETTATGKMSTSIKTLEKLPQETKDKFPALKSYVAYREVFKILSTYLKVLNEACDNGGFLRCAYKTSEVPTGRLSAGKDSKNTYFSPLNIQALPKPHVSMDDVFFLGDRTLFNKKENILAGYQFIPSKYDKDGNHIVPTDERYIGQAEGMNQSLNIRSCITPKMYKDSDENEFIYCSCDYSAEELRVVSNLSREPLWMDAFIHGRDVHESTAKSIWGAENYNRDYRKKAKVCFSTDALIYTDKGAVRGYDLGNNVSVLDLNHKPQFSKAFVEKRKGYKLTLSNGTVTKVSYGHKFKVLDVFNDNTYVPVEELDVGRQLGTVPMKVFGDYKKITLPEDRKNQEKEIILDEDLAYTIGLYLGDGSIWQNSKILGVLVKPWNYDKVYNTLSRYGHITVRNFEGKDYKVLILNKKVFGVKIEELFGRKKFKHCNDIILQSPKTVIQAFVAGLLDSDGSVKKTSIKYDSTLKQLTDDICETLSVLGIHVTSVKDSPVTFKGKDCGICYTINIAYNKALTEIPILNPTSKARIANRKKSTFGFNILESEVEKFKEYRKVGDEKLGNFLSRKTKPFTPMLIEYTNDWRKDYVPVTILKKEPVELETLCMETETHYFYGNCFPSPNCNFGIVYGMSAKTFFENPIFGFKTMEEAENFYEQFKSALPTLFQWEDRVQRRGMKKGYVQTYFGRPRRLKSYYDTHNFAFANRTAVNTMVQGCLTKNVPILTNKGYIPIGKLYKEFKDCEENRDKSFDYKVYDGIEWNDFFPVYRGFYKITPIKLINGITLDCDSRHMVKCVNDKGIIEFKNIFDILEHKDTYKVCLDKSMKDKCDKYTNLYHTNIIKIVSERLFKYNRVTLNEITKDKKIKNKIIDLLSNKEISLIDFDKILNLYNIAYNRCYHKDINYTEYAFSSLDSIDTTKDIVDKTYTLCVLNHRHQFVSNGIISKNTSGDILKIVLCRLWNKLFNNPKYINDVKWLVTIHDEIGYSIRASKLNEIVKIIEDNQSIRLPEWPVPIITEPGIGWSMGHVYDFHNVPDDSEVGFHLEPDLE